MGTGPTKSALTKTEGIGSKTKSSKNKKSPAAKSEDEVYKDAPIGQGCFCHMRSMEQVLVDDKVKLKSAVRVVSEIANIDPVIAVELKGEDISRQGKLYVLSIATSRRSYLIDVLTLQSNVFDGGLRAILEDTAIQKLMFDCRESADLLFYQFNVKLGGVLDIQLLEVMKHPPKPKQPGRVFSRRCDKHYEVANLKEFTDCVNDYIYDAALVEDVVTLGGLISDLATRPLEMFQMEYATACLMSLFKLYDTLSPNDEEAQRLVVASAVYVDLLRSTADRTYDDFEVKLYLPMDVIPDEGRIDFDVDDVNVACLKCNRAFPKCEFSLTQLKLKQPMCRRCKRVQQDITTFENRKRELRNILWRMRFDSEDSGDDLGCDSYNYDYTATYFYSSDSD